MADDPYADRKKITFEQAEGAASLPVQLKPKELSKELRALLWHVVYESFKIARLESDYRADFFNEPWKSIFRAIHIFREHRMADEFSHEFDPLVAKTKDIFVKGSYIHVLGWIQWVLRFRICPAPLSESIEWALKTGRAGYRIVDGNTIVPVGSDQEMHAIQKAFADLAATEFHGARAHLRNAAEALTAGRAADSIRESIHAVESVAEVLEPSGQFSTAVAKLETKVKIHGALKRGFTALYGYTSDQEGIRHPLLDDGTAQVDETDALFMIGACAAFVSYMINKARGAGLLSEAAASK